MVGNVSSVCFADPDPLETIFTIFTFAWYSLPLTRVPNTPRICFPMITLDPGECIVLWTTSTFIFSRAFIVFIALLFSHCSKSTFRVFSHLMFICFGPCYSALVVTMIHVPFSSIWFHTSKIPIKLKSITKKHSSCFLITLTTMWQHVFCVLAMSPVQKLYFVTTAIFQRGDTLNDMDPKQSWHVFIVVVVFWVIYQGEVKDHSAEWNFKNTSW